MDALREKLGADILGDPVALLAVAGIVFLAAVAIVLFKRRGGSRKSKLSPKVAGLIKRGDYNGAASLALKEGDLESAFDLFLRAQSPLRAAHVAKRLDRFRDAAELYERAGDLDNAVIMYKSAGMNRKADEVDAKLRKPISIPGLGDDGTLGEGKLLTPRDRALQAERDFLEALDKSRDGNGEALTRLEELGEEAAEALLSAGETEKAAEICAQAGLVDQAINLYVNLLGDPGSAAKLLSKKGDHKRAAELYEAAGKKERAFAAWVEWSTSAPDPLINLNQVERLGDDRVFRFLETVVDQRPVNAENIDIHYRVADCYQGRNKIASAVALLETIIEVVPDYRDVRERLGQLQVALQSAHSGEPILDEPRPLPEAVEPENDVALQETLDLSKSPAATGEFGPLDVQDSPLPPLPELESIPLEERPFPAERERPIPKDIVEPVTPLREPRGDGQLLDRVVESSALRHLINEMSSAAAKEVSALAISKIKGAEMPPLTIPVSAQKLAQRRVHSRQTRGIEKVEITLNLAYDSSVEASRNGPPIEFFEQLIGGREADLQNIEIYYRLGLAYAAEGKWTEARNAFEQVEEASPGYRDALKRMDELDAWKETMPPFVTGKSFVDASKDQRYTLQGELGAGGMAVVYRARDEALGRDVALKFLSEEISNEPKIHEMFKREARAAAQLNHPNIVTVYDVGTLNGRDFISMELVSGTTVERMLEESEGKLRVLDALRITEAVLKALEYAHSKQIIHRDIKPSNIMKNDLGVIKLMDFGLAKNMDAKAKTTLIAGTPNYMPPEQFTGKDMDARSDLFALGASIYEMLAGRPPFDGMVRAAPPQSLRERNPAVPKLLDTAILRSMEFEKEKRFSSAREMLIPLERILKSVSSYLGAPEPQNEMAIEERV